MTAIENLTCYCCGADGFKSYYECVGCIHKFCRGCFFTVKIERNPETDQFNIEKACANCAALNYKNFNVGGLWGCCKYRYYYEVKYLKLKGKYDILKHCNKMEIL